MTKRVFIIHGWESSPSEGWFPWLKKELEKRDFQTKVPAMPETDYPRIDIWVPFLAKLVKNPDKDTYFVGHSIGCQTIMRYLETINGKIGGAVFVGGWVSLTPMAIRSQEDREIVKPWLEKPIDFEKVKKATRNFVAIFSDNDPFVPLENSKTYKKKLGAKIIIQHNKGHFSGSDNIKKLPVVLRELIKMAK